MQLTRKINAIDKTIEYVRWLPRSTVKQLHFPDVEIHESSFDPSLLQLHGFLHSGPKTFGDTHS